MRMMVALLLCLALAACGQSNPVQPTPVVEMTLATPDAPTLAIPSLIGWTYLATTPAWSPQTTMAPFEDKMFVFDRAVSLLGRRVQAVSGALLIEGPVVQCVIGDGVITWAIVRPERMEGWGQSNTWIVRVR
jgi:hypothetical protein